MVREARDGKDGKTIQGAQILLGFSAGWRRRNNKAAETRRVRSWGGSSGTGKSAQHEGMGGGVVRGGNGGPAQRDYLCGRVVTERR